MASHDLNTGIIRRKPKKGMGGGIVHGRRAGKRALLQRPEPHGLLPTPEPMPNPQNSKYGLLPTPGLLVNLLPESGLLPTPEPMRNPQTMTMKPGLLPAPDPWCEGGYDENYYNEFPLSVCSPYDKQSYVRGDRYCNGPAEALQPDIGYMNARPLLRRVPRVEQCPSDALLPLPRAPLLPPDYQSDEHYLVAAPPQRRKRRVVDELDYDLPSPALLPLPAEPLLPSPPEYQSDNGYKPVRRYRRQVDDSYKPVRRYRRQVDEQYRITQSSSLLPLPLKPLLPTPSEPLLPLSPRPLLPEPLLSSPPNHVQKYAPDYSTATPPRPKRHQMHKEQLQSPLHRSVGLRRTNGDNSDIHSLQRRIQSIQRRLESSDSNSDNARCNSPQHSRRKKVYKYSRSGSQSAVSDEEHQPLRSKRKTVYDYTNSKPTRRSSHRKSDDDSNSDRPKCLENRIIFDYSHT